MFERCDQDTTTIIDDAMAQASQLGHNYLGTEHLLVAISRHRDLLPKAVATLLPPPEDLVARLARDVGAPAQRNADLLRSVGIDLDSVRAAVRRTFGDDAVDELGRRRVHQPWQPWRRPSRRCTSLLAGTTSIAPRAKQAFELARQAADAGEIRPSDLLLGMVNVEDAVANQLLREAGVDPAVLRHRLAG